MFKKKKNNNIQVRKETIYLEYDWKKKYVCSFNNNGFIVGSWGFSLGS